MQGGSFAEARTSMLGSLASGMQSTIGGAITRMLGGGIAGGILGALGGGLAGLFLTKIFGLGKKKTEYPEPVIQRIHNLLEFIKSYPLPGSAYFYPSSRSRTPAQFNQQITQNITAGPQVAKRVTSGIQSATFASQFERGFG